MSSYFKILRLHFPVDLFDWQCLHGSYPFLPHLCRSILSVLLVAVSCPGVLISLPSRVLGLEEMGHRLPFHVPPPHNGADDYAGLHSSLLLAGLLILWSVFYEILPWHIKHCLQVV